MPTVDELISNAKKSYEDALKLLETQDYYDAAEKAWRAIEFLRKALLVAAKIPYEKAKTIAIGLPLFSDILRLLGAKRTLDLYDKLAFKLHIMGFYEEITTPEEITDLILIDVKKLMDELLSLIEVTRKLDLSNVIDLVDKMRKVKQEIIKKSSELLEIRMKYRETLSKAISSVISK